MRSEAKRVIVGMLREAARKTFIPDTETMKKNNKIKKQINADFKQEVLTRPAYYLAFNCGYRDIELRHRRTEKLWNKLKKKHKIKEDKHCGVGFIALDEAINVRGEENARKFQNLAKKIDNAFLTSDAVDIVKLIKEVLG